MLSGKFYLGVSGLGLGGISINGSYIYRDVMYCNIAMH
jgi:hypothetical protein